MAKIFLYVLALTHEVKMFLYVLAISADNKNPQLEKKRSRFSFLKKTFEFFETKLRE